MNKGVLYLIPTPIGEVPLTDCVPTLNIYILNELKHFVVEEVATARSFLARAGLKEKLDNLNFYTLNEHTPPKEIDSFIKILLGGENVGVISETGLPAVADPGAILVEAAHIHDIRVVPLVGPSSLMLALMSSGLDGQRFSFHGYLPIKIDERRLKIKEMETKSKNGGGSQIFIETPYRNDKLFTSLLEICSLKTKICVAANIGMQTEYIKTKSVEQWRKCKIQIGKKPTVFILQAFK